MKKIIQPVAIGIVRNNEKYLLTLRDDADVDEGSLYNDHWQFPGGGLEFGESFEDCLHREMKEEIGTEVRIVRMLPKVFHDVRGNWQGLFATFLCELKDENAKILLNEEASDFGWYTLDEIKPLKQLSLTTEMAELAEKF